MRIDDFLPQHRLHEVEHIAVAAPPDQAWQAVRNIDIQEAFVVRTLFDIRAVPDRLAARLRRRPFPEIRRGRIDDIVAPGTGFFLLTDTDRPEAERGADRRTVADATAPDRARPQGGPHRSDVGREIVIGSVGKFWRPKIDFARVEPKDFVGFQEPGWGKLAWNLRVDPRGRGGSWLTVDVRVTATDDESWRRFERYWRLIGRFSLGIRKLVLHDLEHKLGGAPHPPVAGDDILPHARFERVHSTFIEATPAHVWPWLVQMGCRRAGWYSFDRLDNGGVRSAEAIIPALQKLEVGDVIPARPKGDVGFAVLRMDPAHALVLGSPSLRPGGGPELGPTKVTWAFDLEPIGDFATALTVKVRADYQPSARMAVTALALGVAHEIMERQQLRNLRQRAVRPAL